MTAISVSLNREANKKTGVPGHRSPERRCWNAMMQRCYNEKHPKFHRYGKRGIAVCDRWHIFANFFDDMGFRPSISHSIDRINNDGQYSPDNCKWSTMKEQSRNKEQTVMLTFNGETLCITDWAKRIGMRKNTLIHRISRGWSVERALTEPSTRSIISGRKSKSSVPPVHIEGNICTAPTLRQLELSFE